MDACLAKILLRRYDPRVGRFTQPEPFTGVYALRAKYGVFIPSAGGSQPGAAAFYEPTAVNLYIYAANDPVNSVDPTGYQWWKKTLAVAGVALLPIAIIATGALTVASVLPSAPLVEIPTLAFASATVVELGLLHMSLAELSDGRLALPLPPTIGAPWW